MGLQMLKKFKEKEGFCENVGLGRCTVYFKIGLYKCLIKVPNSKEFKFIIALF